jgi:hypothetical protein
VGDQDLTPWSKICIIQYVFQVITICLKKTLHQKKCTRVIRLDGMDLRPVGDAPPKGEKDKRPKLAKDKPRGTPTWRPDPGAPTPGVIPNRPDESKGADPNARGDNPGVLSKYAEALLSNGDLFDKTSKAVADSTCAYATITFCMYVWTYFYRISLSRGKKKCTPLSTEFWLFVAQFYFHLHDSGAWVFDGVASAGASKGPKGWTGTVKLSWDRKKPTPFTQAATYCAGVSAGNTVPPY